MWEVILSMDDVSACGASRIRRAIFNNVDVAVDSVEVYRDTDRVVVKSWADADTLVEILESQFGQNVVVVSEGRRQRRFEFSSSSDDDSSEDDDDDDDDESSEEEEEDYPATAEDWWPRNASIEWRGTDLSARRIHEPSSSDQPVEDPSSRFYNFTLADDEPSSSSRQDDDDN